MSDSPFLPFIRQEVLDYLRSSEHLLSAAVMPNSPPLSQDELDMIEHYATEVLATLVSPVKK